MTGLSAQDVLHFRHHHAGWEIDDARVWDGALFYIALNEPATLAGEVIGWTIQSPGERCILTRTGCHAEVPAVLFDEVVSRHRSAIVTCLEWHLGHATASVVAARAHVREIRAVIAKIET